MNGVMMISGQIVEFFGCLFFEWVLECVFSCVGVVDVGLNLIWMVVFDGVVCFLVYFYNEKVMVGLGQGLVMIGRLNLEGVRCGMVVLKCFVVLVEGMGIKLLICVVIVVVCEVEDGLVFCKVVEKEIGLKFWVIDGEEEVWFFVQGVLLGWFDVKGLVCDIGGNLMELVELENGKVGWCILMLLGLFCL